MLKRVVGLAAVSAAICAGAFSAAARADNPTSVFARAGVFVDTPQDFPGPWALAAELQADHFSWVALHALLPAGSHGRARDSRRLA
ncbi:MAG TPA: hypothetical protein VN770_05970, partial [Gaiellaceae bacterium]|nr:hypothetical protein [Gaiellaceae bacterium]